MPCGLKLENRLVKASCYLFCCTNESLEGLTRGLARFCRQQWRSAWHHRLTVFQARCTRSCIRAGLSAQALD